MNLETNGYYHIFNRSNNRELLFREEENYLFFLRRYRYFLASHCSTVAYCLMPTHFHLLTRITGEDIDGCRSAFGRWLSSYTKAVNKRYSRHGSLFQQHTKASPIANERYLLTAIAYIHQNPVRAGYVQTPQEWQFSSYPDLAGYRPGTLPSAEFLGVYFPVIEDFRRFSLRPIARPDWL